MFDFRPAGYVIGLLVVVLGAAMALPMLMDIYDGNDHWQVFALSGFVTSLFGSSVALACATQGQKGLSIQQTFFLTTGVWLVLPIFTALPFWIGASQTTYTDAFFEAMSQHVCSIYLQKLLMRMLSSTLGRNACYRAFNNL